MTIATIGSALAERRAFLGLEKGQAADKIGMSRTTYSSYEQDAQRPSVDVFPALAGFLEISMEELLTLYGATCVAAVRPSLERLLSSPETDVVEAESSTESELVIELGAAPEPETEETTVSPFPESLPTPSPAEPEVLQSHNSVPTETAKETTVSPFPESLPTPSPAEPEVLESHSLHVVKEPERSSPSEKPKETAIVLPQKTESARSPAEPEMFESHNLHVLRESERPPALGDRPSLRREELTSWLDQHTQTRESSVSGSVVFEPSPFVLRSSLSDTREKNSEDKKKKKKKKKKKS
jgi:transcriptional regulator with XRE-family HTH domain